MKLLACLGAAVAVAALTTPASAATVQLESVGASGSNFLFTYSGTLSPTEGITNGSKLVILDFLGYVDGSVYSPYRNVVASTEFTTDDLPLAPGITDDASIANLVFTYVGPDFQTDPAPTGGAYIPIDFNGLSALSIYGGVSNDGFTALTVKNEGFEAGTMVYSQGYVGVPTDVAPVPEPATWAMFVGAFGLVGASMRQRRAKVAFAL